MPKNSTHVTPTCNCSDVTSKKLFLVKLLTMSIRDFVFSRNGTATVLKIFPGLRAGFPSHCRSWTFARFAGWHGKHGRFLSWTTREMCCEYLCFLEIGFRYHLSWAVRQSKVWINREPQDQEINQRLSRKVSVKMWRWLQPIVAAWVILRQQLWSRIGYNRSSLHPCLTLSLQIMCNMIEYVFKQITNIRNVTSTPAHISVLMIDWCFTLKWSFCVISRSLT